MATPSDAGPGPGPAAALAPGHGRRGSGETAASFETADPSHDGRKRRSSRLGNIGRMGMRRVSSTGEILSNAADIAREKALQTRQKRAKMWDALCGCLPCWTSMDQREQSNPPGWPDATPPDVVAMRPHRRVEVGGQQKFLFCDNFVKTSRYEWYTFLPMFLMMEFNPWYKIANVYFLIIACMQTIPAITNTFGVPVMLLPLTVIVAIDMIFAISEDWTRHKADAAANAAMTRRLSGEQKVWRSVHWWQLSVGDIILLKNREDVPADVVVIGVHEPYAPSFGGACYVETKSLDGETNLKIRYQTKSLVGKIRNATHVHSLVGHVTMEHPNKNIDHFTGSIQLRVDADGEPTTDPLGPDNLLLRGTVLRNTKWVMGLVVNTGHDTKVMMAMTKREEKSSQLNDRINHEIRWMGALLLVICITGAIGGAAWVALNNTDGEMWYLDWEPGQEGIAAYFGVQLAYLFLLLYGFIPISLYVTQNFVRFFQSMFMNMDLDMYNEVTDTPARVRTMNLNEELGQISHVFSDKTGTLTENVMDFRKCIVGGHAYGRGVTEIALAAMKVSGQEVSPEDAEAEVLGKELGAPHVNFYDPTLFDDLEGGAGPEQKQRLQNFLRALALCHTVIPERQESDGNDNKAQGEASSVHGADEIVLSASSPDEEALVLGAKYFGYEFRDRIDSTAVLKVTPMDGPGKPSLRDPPILENHEVLYILGFNSVRKRMSVILRRPDGRVTLLCKGADTTVAPLLSAPSDDKIVADTVHHMERLACEGLRTLMVASRDIDEHVFSKWESAYDQAINDVMQQERKSMGEPNAIDELMAEVEQGLDLLGATAIEDKLQKGVGDTIEKLIRGGITVWVITGDKEETAINIGVACRLVWSEERMERIVINTRCCKTPEELRLKLLIEFERFSQELNTSKTLGGRVRPRALVIDGPAFSLTDDTPAAELLRSSAVIRGPSVASGDVEKGSNDVKEILSPARGEEREGHGSASLMSPREAFLQLSTICQAVIGCRMTPDQKRQLVCMIKDNLPNARTLSIGDGANDVPMIQAAHIGVGISGQEGLQAVNASDYALGQFRFLQKLILCHGRYNYWRMSLVTTYLFYKSVAWGIPLFVYAPYNAWSGNFFYDYLNSNLWALIYTSLPIILFGVYDMDVKQKTCLDYPWLYRTGLTDNFLRPVVFWGWIMQGVIEGIWVTILCMYAFSGSKQGQGGTPSSLEYGNLAFAIVTVSVNVKMFFIQRRWHWVEVVILAGSTGIMWGFAVALNRLSMFVSWDWDFHGVQDMLNVSPSYWAVLVLGVIGIFIRDLAWRGYHRWWQPKLHHLLMEMEVAGLDSIELPEALSKTYLVDDIAEADAHQRLVTAQGVTSLSASRDGSAPSSRPASRPPSQQSTPRPSRWSLNAGPLGMQSLLSGHGHSTSHDMGLVSLTEGGPQAPLSDRALGLRAAFPPLSPGSGSSSRPPKSRPVSLPLRGAQKQRTSSNSGFAFSVDNRAADAQAKMILRHQVSPGMRRSGSVPIVVPDDPGQSLDAHFASPPATPAPQPAHTEEGNEDTQ